MPANRLKPLLIFGVCAWAAWKMAVSMFGPAVTPGEVTMLTTSNFHEVRKDAGTLVALFTKPG